MTGKGTTSTGCGKTRFDAAREEHEFHSCRIETQRNGGVSRRFLSEPSTRYLVLGTSYCRCAEAPAAISRSALTNPAAESGSARASR
jgi:hypothetical protein